MIDKVLQRAYVRSRAEQLAQSDAAPAKAPPDDLVAVPGELEADLRDPPSDDEIAAAAEELARAAREAEQPDEPPAEGGGRRGAQPSPLEERAYLPRDAITSLAQSALESYLREERHTLLRPAATGGDRRAADESGEPVAELILEIPDEPQVSGNRRLAGAFEITDPGWVNSVFAMGWRLLRRRRKFKEKPAPPAELAPNARVLLVSDWASGHPSAQAVARLMRAELEKGASEGRQQHVIHLGDTYYSGWKKEYELRFLPYWPVHPDEPHGSWACNGNHDMYAGGHAYFDYLLMDPRFAAQDRSSYFSLENEHWQLLGLDTAWEDHGLKAPQADWIATKREKNPNRKTMLLSHHQLFSEYGHDGPKIEAKLGEQLNDKPVEAWFWGHEHRCIWFQKGHRGVGAARCVGHGGIPVYVDLRDFRFPAVWRDMNYREALGGLEKWALFGFVVLDFKDAQLEARYINEWGQEVNKETIT